MRNILMWVTMYDPFASNLGIDKNWNWLHYPWVFILPLQFVLYVESILRKPNFSVRSYTDCVQIVTSGESDCWKLSSAPDIIYSTAYFAAES
jgi:hypothetical protein